MRPANRGGSGARPPPFGRRIWYLRLCDRRTKAWRPANRGGWGCSPPPPLGRRLWYLRLLDQSTKAWWPANEAFRVEGPGFRVQGSESRFQGSGTRVRGEGLGVGCSPSRLGRWMCSGVTGSSVYVPGTSGQKARCEWQQKGIALGDMLCVWVNCRTDVLATLMREEGSRSWSRLSITIH